MVLASYGNLLKFVYHCHGMWYIAVVEGSQVDLSMDQDGFFFPRSELVEMSSSGVGGERFTVDDPELEFLPPASILLPQELLGEGEESLSVVNILLLNVEQFFPTDKWVRIGIDVSQPFCLKFKPGFEHENFE